MPHCTAFAKGEGKGIEIIDGIETIDRKLENKIKNIENEEIGSFD